MKKTVTFTLALAFIVAFLGFDSSTTAQENNKSWTAKDFRIIDEPGEIVAKLGNGLTVIVKENHSAPVAAVRVHVKAGSIYEGEHLGAGLSHLFEHLLAGGTTKDLTEAQSKEIIEQTGARFNASTSKGVTQYFLTVPSRHVGVALSTLASWVTRPTFPENEFSREWGVVQRELEMDSTDVDREQWKLLDELRYIVHPAKYPVIGHQQILQALTRQQIMDYYNTMYIPDHCVVAIVGDIDAEKMLEEVKKEFSDFNRRFVPTINLPDEPEVSSPRKISKVLPFMQGPARLTVAFPSIDILHPDLYALDTLAGIIGDGKSSRLYQKLKEEKQLVIGIGSYNYTPDYADGTFAIQCALDQNNIDPAIAEIWNVINSIKSNGISEEELNRTKKQLQVSHIRSHQTAEQIASTMANDYLSTGDAKFSDHYVENMQKVTAAQVQEMANKYFNSQKQLTLILTGTPLKKNNENKAQAGKQSAIKKIVLDNGLRVLLKRDPTTPLVNMRFMTKGGLLEETDANNGITDMAVSLAVKGTESFANNDIVNYFDNVGGYVNAECGNNTFGFSAEVMNSDFDKSFDIFSEIVLKPTFPEEQLAKLKPEKLAVISEVKNSWQQEAARHFRSSFFTNNPYKRSKYGTEETINSLTQNILSEHYKTSLQAKRSVIAVFGDIDMKKVEDLIRAKFAGLPAGSEIDLEKFAADTYDQRRVIVQKTEKNGSTVVIGVPGMRLIDTTEVYPMEILNQIMGSYTGWLFNILRGKSLVYYAYSNDFRGYMPGYVMATAQCEAEKAPEVISIIEQQLNKAAKGEITDEEISDAKSNLVNSEVFKKLTVSAATMNAAIDELYFNDCNYSSGNPDRYMAVTPDQVRNVAKKYFSQPRTITVNTSKPELIAK